MAFFVSVGLYEYFIHRDEINYNATTDFKNIVKFYDQNGTLVSANSTWDVASNWTSKDVLSAQTWIDISIIARPTDDLPHNQEVAMYFPSAHTEKPEYQNGHLVNAQAPLKETFPNSRNYTGFVKIRYQSEGDKCMILVEPSLDAKDRYPNCPSNFEPVIHISAADSKFQYETNKVNTFIIWLGVGFSVTSIWWYIREIRVSK